MHPQNKCIKVGCGNEKMSGLNYCAFHFKNGGLRGAHKAAKKASMKVGKRAFKKAAKKKK
jgi:hypothetical protein